MAQKYAIAGAAIGFFPGGTFILIPMEVYLIYRIAKKYNAFDLVPFIVMSAALVTIGGFLKGLAMSLHWLPVIGQLANSIVGGGFILIIGVVAEQHYAGKSTKPI